MFKGSSFYDESMLLLLLMMIEHIISYVFTYISEWHIFRYGESDEIGIESTNLSIILDIISLILEVILLFICIYHTSVMGHLIHDMPLVNYFIICDTLISILLIPYSFISKRMLV